MRMEVRHAPNKAVYYWLTKEEAADEKLMKSLEPEFREWKSKKYFPVVFESGSESLEDNMYMLMKRNMELFAKKSDVTI